MTVYIVKIKIHENITEEFSYVEPKSYDMPGKNVVYVNIYVNIYDRSLTHIFHFILQNNINFTSDTSGSENTGTLYFPYVSTNVAVFCKQRCIRLTRHVWCMNVYAYTIKSVAWTRMVILIRSFIEW
jgi:hypothetical protein